MMLTKSTMTSIYKLLSVHFKKILRKCPTFNALSKQKNNKINIKCNGSLSVVATGLLMLNTQLPKSTMKEAEFSPFDEDTYVIDLSVQEARFLDFASVEFNDQYFMTPLDFLDCVMREVPRPRQKRLILSQRDVDRLVYTTPKLKDGSKDMFRTLGDKGLIRYSEYLFLISVLTQPHSGFRIAFDMFDMRQIGRVDKLNYFEMEKIISSSLRQKRGRESSAPELELVDTSKLWASDSYSDLNFCNATLSKHLIDDVKGLQRKHIIDTTLQIHFFGEDGFDDIDFDEFTKFMIDLQYEICELEFANYSKGKPTITELEFVEILLKHTKLTEEDHASHINRLLSRTQGTGQRISFQDFYDFFIFLHNLEDFAIAIRMFAVAHCPVSQNEFSRAVRVCTGRTLNKKVVNTIFKVFDVNGDGYLNYNGFLCVMKDRFHRGFRTSRKKTGWKAFNRCLKTNIRLENAQNNANGRQKHKRFI